MVSEGVRGLCRRGTGGVSEGVLEVSEGYVGVVEEGRGVSEGVRGVCRKGVGGVSEEVTGRVGGGTGVLLVVQAGS